MISPEATASVNKTKKLHTRNITWTHMQEQSIYTLTWNFYWPLQPYNNATNQKNTCIITTELPKNITDHHS